MRRILIFFLLLVLLAAVGLGLFYLFFDVNSYREDIEKQLTSAFGFPVQVVGEMEIKKNLTPTISIPEIKVEKISKQGSVPLMVFKNVDFTFDLPSYLKHIYDVSSIRVKTAQMFFDVNEMESGDQQPEGVISGSQRGRPSLKQKNVYTLSVHHVKMDSVQLIYQDHTNNISKQLAFSDVAISELKRISGTIEYNNERFQLNGQFSDLTTTLRTGMNLVLDFRVMAHRAQNDMKIMIPNLKTLELVRLTLQTKGDSFEEAAQLFTSSLPEGWVGQLPKQPFTLNASMDVLNQRQLKTAVDVNVEDSFSFQIDPFMWDLLDQKEYSGSVHFQTLDEDVLKNIGMKQFSVSAQFVVNPEKIRLDKFSLIVNNSNVDGRVVVQRTEKPQIAAALTSQYFNYQDVMGLLDRTEAKPLDWVLNKAEIDASVVIQHLDDNKITSGYPYVKANISSHDQKLLVRILEPSSFAAGRIVGQIQATQQGEAVQTTIQLLGDNILLNQITPFKAHVRGGYANLNVNLKSIGNTFQEVLQNLTGSVAVILQEGELLSASQTLNRLAETKATASYHVYTHRNIFVKNAIFNLSLKKGVVFLDHNVGIETSNWLDFIIDGSVNLPRQTLELQIYPLRVTKVAAVPDPDPSKYIVIAGPWNNVKVQTKTRKTPMQDGETFLRQLQKRTQLISIDSYLGRQSRKKTTQTTTVAPVKQTETSVEQQVVNSLTEIVAH